MLEIECVVVNINNYITKNRYYPQSSQPTDVANQQKTFEATAWVQCCQISVRCVHDFDTEISKSSCMKFGPLIPEFIKWGSVKARFECVCINMYIYIMVKSMAKTFPKCRIIPPQKKE